MTETPHHVASEASTIWRAAVACPRVSISRPRTGHVTQPAGDRDASRASDCELDSTAASMRSASDRCRWTALGPSAARPDPRQVQGRRGRPGARVEIPVQPRGSAWIPGAGLASAGPRRRRILASAHQAGGFGGVPAVESISQPAERRAKVGEQLSLGIRLRPRTSVLGTHSDCVPGSASVEATSLDEPQRDLLTGTRCIVDLTDGPRSRCPERAPLRASRVRSLPQSARGEGLGGAHGGDDIANGLGGCASIGLVGDHRPVGCGLGHPVAAVGRQGGQVILG